MSEDNKDNGLTSTLRADAPAFNPSFNIPPVTNNNKAIDSSAPSKSRSRNRRDVKRNTTRNRRRQPNKNKSDNSSSLQGNESQTEYLGLGGTGQPTGHKKQNAPRSSRPKRKSRNHTTQTNSMSQRQQDPTIHREEHSTSMASNFYNEEVPNNTLSLESSFPALLPGAPMPSSTQTLTDTPKMQVTTLYASRLLAQSTVDDDANTNAEEKERDDYFARMGLEKLSTTTSSKSKNSLRKWQPPRAESTQVSSESTATESSSGLVALTPLEVSNRGGATEVDLQTVSSELGSATATRTRIPPTSSATATRRSKWDMNRLRDKWWDTIALRTTRNRFLAQLKQELHSRRSEDEVQEDTNDGKHTYKDERSIPVTETFLVEMTGRKDTSTAAHVSDDESQNDSLTFELNTESILQMTDSGALEVVLHQWLDSCKEEPDIYLEKLDSLVYKLVEDDKATLLAVVLDHLSFQRTKLQQCLAATDSLKQLTGNILPKSFFLAGKLGHSDCMSLFLTKGDYASAVFMAKEDNGDNVLHHCCRGNGHAQALQWLLERSSDSSKSGQKQLSKLLLAKNVRGKTALHIACERGRVDLVETFLNTCSIALLSKMLATEDNDQQSPLLAAVAANASEVVMCLIMWRGSHNVLLRNTPQAPTKGVRDLATVGVHSGCPLVWASKHANLEIVLLLLQFSDHTGNEYQLTEALIALLCSKVGLEDDLLSEGCRVLVSEGANPFSEVTLDDTTMKTAISIACEFCSHVVVASLIRVGRDTLLARQQQRRKDPTLRKQPEAFFENLETKENFEMDRALSSALVECLFAGWKCGNEIIPDTSTQPLACAVQLFMAGNPLLPKDISRLHKSLHANQLIGERQTLDTSMVEWCLVAKQHLFAPNLQATNTSKPTPLAKSLAMASSAMVHDLPWFQEFLAQTSGNITCPWVAHAMEERGQPLDTNSCGTTTKPLGDMVVLIAQDGTEFQVHESIVAMKSQKLASAIQFERLKQDNGESSASIVIRMEISALNSFRLLQHMYHGSIICGWSDNDLVQNCQDLLELMMLGEELLCDLLVQECEMRLLSGNPWFCSCWSCSKSRRRSSRHSADSKRPNNHDPTGVTEEAELLYFLADTSPIPMVVASTVLDILAVVQHLETVDLRYEICRVRGTYSWFQFLSSKEAWSAEKLTNGKNYRATQLLKEACIQCILGSFAQVMDSRSFVDSTESEEEASDGSISDNNTTLLSHQMLLLQLCLEDLSSQPLLHPLGATSTKACQTSQ